MQVLNLNINQHLLSFVFFATLCSYNFHYIIAETFTAKEISTHVLLHKLPAIIFVLLGIGGVLIVYAKTQISFNPLFIAAILTLTYSIPLLPFKQTTLLRKAGIVKTLLLAFTWTYVTAFLPITSCQISFTSISVFLLLSRFLLILLICILFDTRDKEIDKINGLSSLATNLSSKKINQLIYVLLIALGVTNFFTNRVVALQISAVIATVVYFMSKKRRGYFFYYFVVDGLMALSALLTSIIKV